MSSTSRIRRWWTEEEDHVLRREANFQLSQGSLNDWNRIAAKLAGRTNKDCRKRWSKIPGHIKKGVWSNTEDERLKSAVKTIGYRWTHVATSVGTRNADRKYFLTKEGQEVMLKIGLECAKRWHHSLDPPLDHSQWMPEDDARLLAAVGSYGRVWKTIGEKEFLGRSAVELKNRFVVVDKKRQQPVDSTTLQTVSKGSTISASSREEVDMEDSESTNSLSEDNGDFNSDILSHATSITTTGSNFPSHTTSSLNTPGSYAPSHNVSPHVTTGQFSFLENESSANLQTHRDRNDIFSSVPGSYFHQNQDNDNSHPLPLEDSHTLDLGATWNNMTPLSSPQAQKSDKMKEFSLPAQKPNDDAMTGVEAGQVQEEGSTLILEDVQPQMVTSIISLLFESKSVVKMNIVSQR